MLCWPAQTNYENGELLLTSHRLLWGRAGEIATGQTVLCLHLKYVRSLGKESAGSFFTGKKKRLILNLRPINATDKRGPGPQDLHNNSMGFIKLSGNNGIGEAFVAALRETVLARMWEVTSADNNAAEQQQLAMNEVPPPRIKLRTGIVGIERGIAERQQQTDHNINVAFQDLSKLMGMAKDMVVVSKAISAKIRERQGDISDDETVRFKSYLMSLGIDDPVTRDANQSNSDYYRRLSAQICEMVLDPLTDAGGMMSLADVYCRINRARGLELLSPEDLLNACKMLANGPIKWRQFPSGAMVLQLETHDDEAVARETGEKVHICHCECCFFLLLLMAFNCLFRLRLKSR